MFIIHLPLESLISSFLLVSNVSVFRYISSQKTPFSRQLGYPWQSGERADYRTPCIWASPSIMPP